MDLITPEMIGKAVRYTVTTTEKNPPKRVQHFGSGVAVVAEAKTVTETVAGRLAIYVEAEGKAYIVMEHDVRAYTLMHTLENEDAEPPAAADV
ncbi:MAG: hypothetical protein EOO77_39000, partial [Oxalobacteraceae bacterium]